MSEKVNVRGVRFDSFTMDETIDCLCERLREKLPTAVYTPNAEIVQACIEDESLYRIINSAEVVIPDGIGVIKAARICKTPLRKRLPASRSGSDSSNAFLICRRFQSTFSAGNQVWQKSQLKRCAKNTLACGLSAVMTVTFRKKARKTMLWWLQSTKAARTLFMYSSVHRHRKSGFTTTVKSCTRRCISDWAVLWTFTRDAPSVPRSCLFAWDWNGSIVFAGNRGGSGG